MDRQENMQMEVPKTTTTFFPLKFADDDGQWRLVRRTETIGSLCLEPLGILRDTREEAEKKAEELNEKENS